MLLSQFRNWPTEQNHNLGRKSQAAPKAEFFIWRKLNWMTRDMGCTWEGYDASYSNLAAEEEVAVDAKLYISGNFLPNLYFRNFYSIYKSLYFAKLYISGNFLLARTSQWQAMIKPGFCLCAAAPNWLRQFFIPKYLEALWLRQVFILKKIGCCRRQLLLLLQSFSSKPPGLAWQAPIWIRMILKLIWTRRKDIFTMLPDVLLVWKTIELHFLWAKTFKSENLSSMSLADVRMLLVWFQPYSAPAS